MGSSPPHLHPPRSSLRPLSGISLPFCQLLTFQTSSMGDPQPPQLPRIQRGQQQNRRTEHPPNRTRPDIDTKRHMKHHNSRCLSPRMNSQDNKPPPEASNPIAKCSEKHNIAEAQDRDFKIAIRYMFNDP